MGKPAYIATLLLLLVSGCGLMQTTEHVVLALQVSVTPINIGLGARVFLNVVDERPQRILGEISVQKLTGDSWQVGSITTLASGDPSLLMHDSLRSGLLSLGFDVQPSPEASSAYLEIHLRSLGYYFSYGYSYNIDSVSNFVASAEADVHKGRTLAFQRVYNISVQPITWGTRRGREEKINAVLADLIGKILADLELLAALK